MKIKEQETYLRIEGKDSHGKFSIEISKYKDPFWKDNKIQMRFQEEDSDCYMNMTIEELKVLNEMIQKIIDLNSLPKD